MLHKQLFGVYVQRGCSGRLFSEPPNACHTDTVSLYLSLRVCAGLGMLVSVVAAGTSGTHICLFYNYPHIAGEEAIVNSCVNNPSSQHSQHWPGYGCTHFAFAQVLLSEVLPAVQGILTVGASLNVQAALSRGVAVENIMGAVRLTLEAGAQGVRSAPGRRVSMVEICLDISTRYIYVYIFM